ncbi:MAG: hypothetical protein ABJB34_03730 [Acidobacteriota bacterium]
MNSEELEVSLRTEFESYLKGVFAGMQQDVVDFQKNFEAEFEKHRSQMDEAFRGLNERFGSEIKFDKGFTESVVEHLRLARDDGAQLSANAFDEAQKLEQGSAPAAHYDQLRDAINDISNQTTQSGILKSLVDHVSKLTPRGAFFIVKSENLVCWRRFDRTGNFGDDSVREINLPISADTLLAAAVRELCAKDNASTSHTEDAVYLDALGFSRPDRMFAVPLIARGRGVAVLYADSDNDDDRVQLDAIESLVRVAGLTVELRAASAAAQPGVTEASSSVPMHAAEQVAEVESVVEASEANNFAVETPVSNDAVIETEAPAEFEEYTGKVAVEDEELAEPETHVAHSEAAATEEESYFAPVAEVEPEIAGVENGYGEVETSEPIPAEEVSDFAFGSDDVYDASVDVTPEPVEEYEYATETPSGGSNGHSYEAAPEPVVEVAAAQTVKSRLSDRHVDLPIEVSDDERRLHNDARRFARLLVSEIKLYNEQKVNEGRGSADLYDRLRDAIDRSREMYEKRVQPQVAAKFDYFHYELVSNLAEGNDAKLGASYPGAAV